MKGQWYIIASVLLSFILLVYANSIRSNYFINYNQLSSFDISPFLNLERGLKKYIENASNYYLKEEIEYFFDKVNRILPTEGIYYNLTNLSYENSSIKIYFGVIGYKNLRAKIEKHNYTLIK